MPSKPPPRTDAEHQRRFLQLLAQLWRRLQATEKPSRDNKKPPSATEK